MRKACVFVSAVALLAACSQPTAPARDDTVCRSGISISSGEKCPK